MHILKPTQALFALFLLPTVAIANETGTMRCNSGIVSIGDTAAEVMSKCGQPAYVTQRLEKEFEEGTRGTHDRKVVEVAVDDWTFNFGPNQFQYEVLLKNGRVFRIESLNNYGY